MTADPDVVPEARRIPVLGREQAVEFAAHGAEVLHAGALQPAARGGIVVRIANVADPDAPGSRIVGETPRAGPIGLAHRPEVAIYREALALGRDQGVQLAELMQELAAAGLEPHRAAFTGREAVVLVTDGTRAAEFAAKNAPRAALARGLASFAVIGRELDLETNLEASVRDLAARAGVRIEVAPGGSSPSSRVFLAPAAALSDVVRAVHAGLFGAIAADDELLPQPGPGQVVRPK